MLTLTIQTGLRVSELIALNCGDIQLGTGAHVRCEGKGRLRGRTYPHSGCRCSSSPSVWCRTPSSAATARRDNPLRKRRSRCGDAPLLRSAAVHARPLLAALIVSGSYAQGLADADGRGASPWPAWPIRWRP